MNVKDLILEQIKKKGKVRAVEMMKLTGFTRAYVNRFFQELRDDGRILLFGQTNRAVYVLANSKSMEETRDKIWKFQETFTDQKIHEDEILKSIKLKTGIYVSLPSNVTNILDYAFLVLVNNVIDHADAKSFKVKMERSKDGVVVLSVEDDGVGIFEKIQESFKLPDTVSAVQELLKGKKTTDPSRHVGRGIFFISKMADNLSVKSAGKILQINNALEDLFLESKKTKPGTTVSFTISTKTTRTAEQIFSQFTSGEYEFTKTQVSLKMYKIGRNLLSRAEAKRIMTGLDDFRVIVLDFQNVETVSESFANEIFKVWQSTHPDKRITCLNTNENIEFAVKRVRE